MKYILLVNYSQNIINVVTSDLKLDSEYNIYYEESKNLENAFIFNDDNIAFKKVKKALSFNKDYKVIKIEMT